MVLCAECRVSWDTEFGPLVTGYSATCGNDDSKPCFICCSAREVGNFAEVGFFEPGLDYCLGGGGFKIPKKITIMFFFNLWVLFGLLKCVCDCMVVLTVFCFGRSCMLVM